MEKEKKLKCHMLQKFKNGQCRNILHLSILFSGKYRGPFFSFFSLIFFAISSIFVVDF